MSPTSAPEVSGGARPAGFRLPLVIFLAAAALNLAWLGAAPLLDTTEARHAEVGREFAADGRWLVPTHNGWPHLAKPPLTDWLAAAGIRLFGANEFGARFFNALAAALAVALTAALAGALAGRRAAIAAAVLLTICPLHLALSRVIAIDTTLAALAAGFYLTLWKLTRPDCRRRWLLVILLGALLGLSGLAKGHIALLVMFVPALVWLAAGRRWLPPAGTGRPTARSLALAAAGLVAVVVVALAIAGPWFLYIIKAFPGWLRAIIAQEFGERISGHEFGSSLPGTSVAYLLVGAMPAVPLALAAVVGCRRARPDDAGAAGGPGLPGGACALLVLWIALPLAVFSAVKGQRMNYVEPLVPAAAVLAGVAWSRLGGDPAAAGRLSRAMACASALVLAAFGGILAVAALPLLNNDFALEPGTRALIIAAGLIAGLAGVGSCLLLRRGRAGRAAGTFLAGAAAFWALSVPAIREYEEQRTTRASCRWLRAHIAPDDQVMLYRDYVHSVGFYLGRRVPVAVPTADTRGLAGAWRSWPGRAGPEFTPDEAGLLRAARAPGGVWLIAKPRRERDLVALAREQDLGLEVRRIEPDVFVAHLGPALPEKR